MLVRRIRWLVCAAVAVVAVVAIAGVLYQKRGAELDAELYPPPGRLVPIGDHSLHLNCMGEGKPTVVLEALSGGSSTEWAWIQPDVARTTRVCSYDRSGRAWSDPHAPGDLWETAEKLHTLLRNAKESGPYILVGHSIGGLYARAFASRYRDEVAGLALVDSSHPEQFDRYPALAEADNTILRLLWAFPWMARVGLFRYYFSQGGEIDFQHLPKRQHGEMASMWSSPQFFESLIDELALSDKIFVQAHSLGPLENLPLSVVTAGTQSASWFALQAELASLSSRSCHVIVEEATHSSLAFNPEHAKQTASAILSLVKGVREGRWDLPSPQKGHGVVSAQPQQTL